MPPPSIAFFASLIGLLFQTLNLCEPPTGLLFKRRDRIGLIFHIVVRYLQLRQGVSTIEGNSIN
jgi:hypothetical protein